MALSSRKRIIVVGAGLSGLACARALADHGHGVMVLDKGRAPGGRASTRHEPGARDFDHGAQFFTARSEWLVRQTASWASDGVIAAWRPRVAPGSARRAGAEETWWVGTPGMGSLAGHLARGLDVRTDCTVTSLTRRGAGWAVHVAASGAHADRPALEHEADALVVAVPAPQCSALVEASSPSLAAVAASATLDPCWAAMIALARGGDDTPFDLLEPAAGPLAWAAREASKPGHAVPEGEDTWILHASPEWSRAHLEDSREDVAGVLAAALLAELAKLGCAAGEVRHARAHRWRFARARTPAHQGCLHDPETHLAVCGDWLESARIEGAFTSGLAAAGRVHAALE